MGDSPPGSCGAEGEGGEGFYIGRPALITPRVGGGGRASLSDKSNFTAR
jgi:hypothetical protein